MPDSLFCEKQGHLLKANTTTDSHYGCDPFQRPIEQHLMYGVVNLNKPAGPTSHEVTAWVRDMLELPRAGHSGSLDPKVTGVLPIMLGKATKAVSVLRLSGKEYVCMMRLHKKMPASRVKAVCAEFVGPIYQTPPIISAVKRALRVRNIYSLDVLDIQGPLVLMKVRCEAGTYIRKLCHDIGLVLGCGGHMQQLIRTGTGPFNDSTAVTLQDLKDAYVLWKEEGCEDELRKVVKPMEEGLAHLPAITIRDSAINAICHGAALAVTGVVGVDEGLEKDAPACIFSLKGEVVALCNSKMSAEEILASEHGICAVTERVIMDADIYPSGWKSKSQGSD